MAFLGGALGKLKARRGGRRKKRGLKGFMQRVLPGGKSGYERPRPGSRRPTRRPMGGMISKLRKKREPGAFGE